MAGEIFIARQDTLEAVKSAVDGIDSGVNQTNTALGNFAGGGYCENRIGNAEK